MPRAILTIVLRTHSKQARVVIKDKTIQPIATKAKGGCLNPNLAQ